MSKTLTAKLHALRKLMRQHLFLNLFSLLISILVGLIVADALTLYTDIINDNYQAYSGYLDDFTGSVVVIAGTIVLIAGINLLFQDYAIKHKKYFIIIVSFTLLALLTYLAFNLFANSQVQINTLNIIITGVVATILSYLVIIAVSLNLKITFNR